MTTQYHETTKASMLRDLAKIQAWLDETKTYVERGYPDHATTVEDEVFYYRHIRKVACSF